jgi:hypothetical protein
MLDDDVNDDDPWWTGDRGMAHVSYLKLPTVVRIVGIIGGTPTPTPTPMAYERAFGDGRLLP